MLRNKVGKAAVRATVDEVLPLTGLAYLHDDQTGHWTVTKSTAGSGLHTLRPGLQLLLQVEHHPRFSIVRQYQPLDPHTAPA